jgi:hypothetical protein
VLVYKAALPAKHLVAIEGPLTSVERTLVDMARTRSRRRGLVPLDAALHMGSATNDQLKKVLADCAGWPGIGAARALIESADERTESLYRLLFVEHDLPASETQQIIEERDRMVVSHGLRLARARRHRRGRRNGQVRQSRRLAQGEIARGPPA